ncbi:hypothetical protein DZ860_16090 [Vibrio sinensis]|uniref:Uncharacterized protein n=1 Tax=Vibrio sinensis TaxID=2302434 RepID=A0A3A6QAM2_9VIBR|nr:hypothetical protein [Vibrio sinensis]RJX68969.1 hypothetical protein DZ860_16090 [Vibrio sinensis]
MRSLLLLVIIAAGVLAWVFIPTHESMGKQVLEQPLNDTFRLVGHRIYSTDPDSSKMFSYFVLSDATNVEDEKPFLTTSDQFVRAKQTGDNTISLTVNGRIYQYHNDLWVKMENGQLHHWYVSTQSNYVR